MSLVFAVAASRAVTRSLMDINDHINNDDNDQAIRHRREGVSSAQANLLLHDETATGQDRSPEDTTVYTSTVHTSSLVHLPDMASLT